MDLLNSLKRKVYSEYPELESHFESINFYYGKIIFQNRVNLNMTQQELADKCKISKCTLVKAESGYENITQETLNEIFDGLGLKTQEIVRCLKELSDNEHTATLVSISPELTEVSKAIN